MNFYFKGIDFENMPTYIIMGGRASTTEKRLRFISMMCQYLFGGVSEFIYNPKELCYYITIRNDDIGEMTFSILDETLRHEPLNVRLSRMCEEYDAYMFYKFRDYVEEHYND